MLARTGTQNLWQSRSRDGGLTWDMPGPSPLTSHNCPAALLRLAGEEAVVAVCNAHPQRRLNLAFAVSEDGCRTWTPPRRIGPVGQVSDQAEASYPNACQLPDGSLVVVFGQIDRGDPDSRFTIYGVRLGHDQVRA
jgi:Neuraminidase (sialidase)